MRVKYLGPAVRIRANRDSEYVKRGQEIDLPDATVAVLRAAGHRFTAADRRYNLPEPTPEAFEAPVEPEPEATTVEPDEP